MQLAKLRSDRRLFKAAIIGLAGLALVVGGGTFALWYDSEQIAGGTINSGALHIEVTAAGSWANQDGPIADIATYLIVPGDVLTLTQPVDVTAQGTELLAQLTLDTSNITGDPTLAAALDTSMTIAAPPVGMTLASPGVYNVTGALGTQTVSVQVQITFPQTTDGLPLAPDRSNYWNLQAQNELVNLTSIKFDLVQTVV